MRLPNLFIIGAAKSGTSSLRKYLGQHPDIFFSPEKEPAFFAEEYERGADWYVDRFYKGWSAEPYGGESGDKMYPRYMAARIAEVSPDAKILAILRDPVDRAFSHWWMNYSRGKERLGFRNAIEANFSRSSTRSAEADGISPDEWRRYRQRYVEGILEQRFYVEFGEYRSSLERYYRCFPKTQITVVFNRDLMRSPYATLNGICDFLSIPRFPVDGIDLDRVNAAKHEVRSPLLHTIRRAVRSLGIVIPGERSLARSLRRLLTTTVDAPAIDQETAGTLREHYDDVNRGLLDLVGGESPPDWVT